MRKPYPIFILLLLLGFVTGQNTYPADSLLKNPETGLLAKAGLLPVAAWERISFHSDFLNCQFSPSCSIYGAHAIAHYGLFRGSIMAADRIVRCSPFARHYQVMDQKQIQADGRLVDPVVPLVKRKSGKSPSTAALLSTVLPGAGRVYAGKPLDGLMGFMTVAMFYSSYRISQSRGHTIRAGILLTGTITFYFGEIYGAWREARYR